MTLYELNPAEYNMKLAAKLKEMEEFEAPAWSVFVKTGVGKVRPPAEADFWQKRAASILRQIYMNKIVGVNKLKTRYGNKKNRGCKPEEFRKASGKIIRTMLQQADKAGLTEKVKIPKAGRKLTKKGKEFLDSIN